MEFNKYQELAMRTVNKELTQKELVINGVMGLNGEAGEAIDIVKKHLFQKHSLEEHKLIRELGDCLWYLAECAEGLGIELETIATTNILKLHERYPEGFKPEDSIYRVEQGD